MQVKYTLPILAVFFVLVLYFYLVNPSPESSISRSNADEVVDQIAPSPEIKIESVQTDIRKVESTVSTSNAGESTIDEKENVDKIKNSQEALYDFFEKQNSRINIDIYGTYWVDISTEKLASKEFILSKYPIYYPSEQQLNYGFDGCGIGGFYVDVSSVLTLVTEIDRTVKIFHNECSFDEHTQSYLFRKSDSDPHLQQQISKLLQPEDHLN